MKTVKACDLKVMVVDELQRLAKGKIPYNEHYGICFNLSAVFSLHQEGVHFMDTLSVDGYELVDKLSANWELFSGLSAYPVEGCASFVEWDVDTFYGRCRRNLCEHLADEVEALSLFEFCDTYCFPSAVTYD